MAVGQELQLMVWLMHLRAAQFSVKHEQDIDCGGGYIKVIPKSR